MKVAIDISPLKSGHQFRGIGSYTKNLIEEMQLIKADDFSVKLVENGQTPKDCDLTHYPYFDLFFLTLPLVKTLPIIVTVHDVIPLIFPKRFPPGIKGKAKFQIQKFSLKSVKAILTDSQVSKDDIVNYLDFPRQKIFVVPLAPGKEFKKLKVESEKGSLREIPSELKVKKKYRLPDNFILYVGDVNYHKNIPGLIKAFSKLDRSFNLVLVGKAFGEGDLKETGQMVQLIKSLNLDDRVMRLGWVFQNDLPAIYNLANVYCQPSFYEGFGLPVLEAMACGVPVVAAKVASLPEIAVKAGVLVDPYDIDSIARGIKEAVANRNELIRKGLVQAKRFNWKKTARQTFQVYKKVFEECQK